MLHPEYKLPYDSNFYPDSTILKSFLLTEEIEKRSSCFLWVYEAWSYMLYRKKIISSEDASKIFPCLLGLEDSGEEKRNKYDGAKGPERFLIEKLGEDVGGNCTLARTQATPFYRMMTRMPYLRTMCTVLQFMQNILALAEKNVLTVMPGYTHLQHAQPTTFAHYLLSVYDPVFRIYESAEYAFSTLNLDELGSGALAGTSWPIDRNLTARLLGFDGIIENSNDAVSGSDCYVNICSALANLMSIVSRLALDLNYWSTLEWNILDVPRAVDTPSHSFMMPNKVSNKRDLENARVAAAKLAGRLMESVAMAQRTTHADMHEMVHMKDSAIDASIITQTYLSPFLLFMPRITADKERMLEIISQGFSTATELNNILARKYKMSYRAGHEIVNKLAHIMRERNLTVNELTVELLDEAAEKTKHSKVKISPKDLKKAVDPLNFVRSHCSQGGPAPKEVTRQLQKRRKQLAEKIKTHWKRVHKIDAARKQMREKLEHSFE